MSHCLNVKKQNKNIFSVSSNGSLGGTFLEWSIHWITGNEIYYNTSMGNIPLVSTPINTEHNNSHLHIKNHPGGFDQTKQVVKKLQQSDNNLVSLYPVKLHFDNTNEFLKLPKTEQIDKDQWNILLKEQNDDWVCTWNYLEQQGIKRIHIVLPNHLYLYKISTIRSLERQLFACKKYNNITEMEEDTTNNFFKDSLFHYGVSQYSKMKIWDRREFLALTLQSTPSNYDNCDTELQNSHKFINVQSLWHDGERVVLEIIDCLGLVIDKNRLHHWKTVYQEWQRLQLNIVNFVYDFNLIIKSIVHNYDFDLSPYNLSLQQEAVIQNKLIRDYNLTIKNWQLEKFPNNTKGIHALLEENFHKL
jgi:hypothetical protein